MNQRSGNERTMDDFVYVGFNSKVVALDRYTGELAWTWHSPKGSGYPAILLDGDRLIVSIQGYTYCIDPIYGQQVWENHLSGLGVGTPCLASVRGGSSMFSSAVAQEIANQQAAASSSGAVVATTAATSAG